MPAPQIKTKPKKPAPPLPPKPVVKVAGKEALTVKRVPKNFTIGPLDRSGKKILLYADSGMGKTTLGMLLNNPAFIAIDDGVYIMTHPVTGEKINGPQDVQTYQDVCDILDSNILDPFDDIVVDTVTDIQRAAVAHILNTRKTDKKQKGDEQPSLKDYGWHAGFCYWYEAMESLTIKLNYHVQKGKNIILLAQSTGTKFTNEYGEDYKKAGPDLYHEDKWSIYKLITRWSDYILRINYTDATVTEKKAASGGSQRAVYLKPTVQFEAKSRTDFGDEFDCVEFKDKTDNSIWRLLFDGGE